MDINLGGRIREYRQAAGVSQDDLAKRVFVARQTVSNWETDKTLPDVQSLKLLAGTFGITVDELLGDDGPELVRRTAKERHTLLMWILSDVIFVLETVLTGLAEAWLPVLIPGVSYDGILPIDNVLDVLVGVLLLFWSLKANRVRADRDLNTAVEIAAFIEGCKPGATAPDTFLWRWVLPHWTLWNVVLALVFAAVLFASLAFRPAAA